MGVIGWDFPPLQGGGVNGFTNGSIESFRSKDSYTSLMREICQNSLDAHDPDSDLPVTVKFDLREIDANQPFFRQYGEKLARCRRFWAESKEGIPSKLEAFLDRAESALNEKSGKVTTLVVSDYNTTGLTGVNGNEGPWRALTYADGVNCKQDDNSGGTYGVGHFAPFACSTLQCVGYSTRATDKGEAFVAIGLLASMSNENGKTTMGTGRYQFADYDKDIWKPVLPEDNDAFARQFARDECGTDVIIFGFDRSDDFERDLERSVLKNYFVAIHDKKLVVEVCGNRIDHDTLPELFERCKGETEMKFFHQCYELYSDPEASRHDISVLDENDGELYINTNCGADVKKGVAFVRSNGMLIQKFSPRVFQPYVAIFRPKDNLEAILRNAEPPEHNCWTHEVYPKSSPKRKEARHAINQLKNTVRSKLNAESEIIVGDVIDVAGAAQYLPDTQDGDMPSGGGDDVLRPVIKFGKTRKRATTVPSKKQEGKKGVGTPTNENFHNHTTRADEPDKSDTTPKTVDPGDTTKPTEGVAPGKGTKTMETPVKARYRAFCKAPSAGIYSLKVVPEETATNVYATVSSFGENGKRIGVTIKKAMLNGQSLDVDAANSKVGPFAVTESQGAEIILTFAEHEPMALSVDIAAKGE